MGLFLSRLTDLFSGFSERNPSRVLMLGLDAAGKTTILYKIKLNENVNTVPTIGFNVETVTPRKGLSFTVWDVGGQEKIRALWKHYYSNSDGLLFVVDSADRLRINEAREELFGILEDIDMQGVPVVVIANKQDLPGAMKPSEMVDKLELRRLVNHKWHIQATNAIYGDGIYESMDALANLVKEFKQSKRLY